MLVRDYSRSRAKKILIYYSFKELPCSVKKSCRLSAVASVLVYQMLNGHLTVSQAHVAGISLITVSWQADKHSRYWGLPNVGC